MATLKNSMVPNVYGGGNEQILTMDDDSQFVIKNSFVPNVYGDGNEKVINQINGSNSYSGNYSDNPLIGLSSLKAIFLALLGIGLSISAGLLIMYSYINF